MLMLHSALQCCAPFLECIEHSVHSKSLALKCTRHSVHSTQWTLSTQCHSPYRHSVLSASIVCGPCSGPSRHTGGRRCSGAMELWSSAPGHLCLTAAPGPALPPDPPCTFFFEIFFRAMISLKTLSKQGRCRDEGAATAGGRAGGTDGAQRRDSGDAGVETAAARASRRV